MSEQPAERTPAMVHCGDCGHSWAVAYLPMEAGAFARLLRSASCPKCAAPVTHVFVGLDLSAKTEASD